MQGPAFLEWLLSDLVKLKAILNVLINGANLA